MVITHFQIGRASLHSHRNTPPPLKNLLWPHINEVVISVSTKIIYSFNSSFSQSLRVKFEGFTIYIVQKLHIIFYLWIFCVYFVFLLWKHSVHISLDNKMTIQLIVKKSANLGVPGKAQWLTNLTRSHKVAGLIPGLPQCVKDLAFPWTVV